MRLQADRVAVSGAHAPLLPATSVSARTGEVTLVAGEPGYGQAALALALGAAWCRAQGPFGSTGPTTADSCDLASPWWMCPASPSPKKA